MSKPDDIIRELRRLGRPEDVELARALEHLRLSAVASAPTPTGELAAFLVSAQASPSTEEESFAMAAKTISAIAPSIGEQSKRRQSMHGVLSTLLANLLKAGIVTKVVAGTGAVALAGAATVGTVQVVETPDKPRQSIVQVSTTEPGESVEEAAEEAAEAQQDATEELQEEAREAAEAQREAAEEASEAADEAAEEAGEAAEESHDDDADEAAEEASEAAEEAAEESHDDDADEAAEESGGDDADEATEESDDDTESDADED